MSNTQRQQFETGTRIRLSVEGNSEFPKMSGMCGVVVGGSRDANCVAVLLDGRKSRQVFHTRFIEPEIAVVYLNPFDLPDYPPSPKRKRAKKRDDSKGEARLLVEALIRNS